MNFFLSTGTRKDTNMLNGPANLRKFHRRKRDKFYSKDPPFLCRKTLRNGTEFRQDWYLSLRTLSNFFAPWIFIWHVLFGIANFSDHEHKRYWTSVALYSIVAPCKIIRYIPLSDSFRGILASIIEMPHCGKFNSHSVYHSVNIVVKLEIIHISHVYKINIPWGLVQMFVCLPLEFLVDF